MGRIRDLDLARRAHVALARGPARAARAARGVSAEPRARNGAMGRGVATMVARAQRRCAGEGAVERRRRRELEACARVRSVGELGRRGPRAIQRHGLVSHIVPAQRGAGCAACDALSRSGGRSRHDLGEREDRGLHVGSGDQSELPARDEYAARG